MRWVLWILAIASVIGMFVTGTDPILPALEGTWLEPRLYRLRWTNGIAFNLSVGFLVSLFFWYLLVYVPEKRRRDIVRQRLTRQYQRCKHEIVQYMVWACGEQLTTAEIDRLTEPDAFRDYFNGPEPKRLYDAANGFERDRSHFKGMVTELTLLSKEVTIAIQLSPIRDVRIYDSLMTFVDRIERLQTLPSLQYEEVKYTMQLVYELLGRWSFASGQLKEDVVQDMIDSL